jgi:hypothetical protein
MLIFGYREDHRTNRLFRAVRRKQEGIEHVPFEALHTDLRGKHDIGYETVYNGELDIIYAYGVSVGSKGCSSSVVAAEELGRTEEYTQRFRAFFEELGVQTILEPQWHLVTYLD